MEQVKNVDNINKVYVLIPFYVKDKADLSYVGLF